MGRTVPKKTHPVQSNKVGSRKAQRVRDEGGNAKAKKPQTSASPRATSSPKSVVHFVYSEAVVCAVRDELNSHPVQEDGVHAETTPRQTSVEIMKLPDIYQHVVSVGLDRFDLEESQPPEPPGGKPSLGVSVRRNLKQGQLTDKASVPSPRKNKVNAVTQPKSDRKHKTDILTLPTN